LGNSFLLSIFITHFIITQIGRGNNPSADIFVPARHFFLFWGEHNNEREKGGEK